MTNTETKSSDDTAIRIIDSIQDAEHSALEAVRKFLDDVNEVFPELSEDSPRRKIIDSAFNMTQKLIGASNELAQRIVKVTEKALGDQSNRSTSTT